MYKKRIPEEEAGRNSRLEEAVAACRSGTMSQAAAAAAFQVPKTSIWRRLQKTGKVITKNEYDENMDKIEVIHLKGEVMDEEELETYYEVKMYQKIILIFYFVTTKLFITFGRLTVMKIKL